MHTAPGWGDPHAMQTAPQRLGQSSQALGPAASHHPHVYTTDTQGHGACSTWLQTSVWRGRSSSRSSSGGAATCWPLRAGCWWARWLRRCGDSTPCARATCRQVAGPGLRVPRVGACMCCLRAGPARGGDEIVSLIPPGEGMSLTVKQAPLTRGWDPARWLPQTEASPPAEPFQLMLMIVLLATPALFAMVTAPRLLTVGTPGVGKGPSVAPRLIHCCRSQLRH